MDFILLSQHQDETVVMADPGEMTHPNPNFSLSQKSSSFGSRHGPSQSHRLDSQVGTRGLDKKNKLKYPSFTML